MALIYLVSANPFPDRPLKIEVEQREIIRQLPTSWDIKPAPAARVSDIISDLRRYSPDIIHFSAHGSPMEQVVLLDDEGKPVEISRAIMNSLFSVMQQKIRLVVMNSCYSKTQAEELASFIDCVIGTDSTIKDTNAITFARQFYQALVAGRSVGKAVEEASILLTSVADGHKPALIPKRGIDPDFVSFAGRRGRTKTAQPSPPKGEIKLRLERKKAFEASAALFDVSADRFSMLKIGNPDGSYVIQCEIEGLRCTREPIEELTWAVRTTAGLVMAPRLSQTALDDGILWETDPDPPPKNYQEVLRNLGTIRGKFRFTSPIQPTSLQNGSSQSLAFTMQVLNADALTVWEYYSLYSKDEQTDAIGQKLNGPPLEYFAQLIWIPVKEAVLGVRLPFTQATPAKYRYYELQNVASSSVPVEQVRSHGLVRTGPDYQSEWGKANAKWRRNIGTEKMETISTGPAMEVRTRYPLLGGYNTFHWQLPDPKLPPEIVRLSEEARTIRAGLIDYGKARLHDQQDDSTSRIKAHFEAVHKAAAAVVLKERKDKSFATSFLAWDAEERKLVVADVCRQDGRHVDLDWAFWAPFGLGVAGMCFRAGTGAFRYKRDQDHRSPDRPENYLPFPGAKPHEYLLVFPIDHPGMTATMADLPDNQRSRQLVGVLTLASYSPASPLLEYCQETLTDEMFAKLRDLRDSCQKAVDVISILLLEADSEGEPGQPTSGTTPVAEPDPATVTAPPLPPVARAPVNRQETTPFFPQGILHQPGPGWRSTVNPKCPYKVVAFDLDGSLIRGDKYIFSWDLVWRTLGFGIADQNKLRREYHRRADKGGNREARVDSYRQWCEGAIEKFKENGLTRIQLQQMAKQLRLTVNCHDALRVLRSNGIVTALISGGIDVFLEVLMPDFREYFDFVFVNQFVFNAYGMVSGIKATAYDFEGKADALALICERAGASPDQTVFVGDHYNDKTVMAQAKKAIAYPCNDAVPDGVAHVTILEDNLMAILPHILTD